MIIAYLEEADMISYDDYMQERIQAIQKNESILTRILVEERKRFFEERLQLEQARDDKIHELEEKRDAEVARLKNIEEECEGLIEAIKDKVYFKHVKKFNRLADRSENIESDIREFKINLGYLNNGKIPPWISNIFYVFNHHWKEELSKRIFELYWKIKNGCEAMIDKVRSDYDEAISKAQSGTNEKILVIKEKIIASVHSAIKDSTNEFLQILQG